MNAWNHLQPGTSVRVRAKRQRLVRDVTVADLLPTTLAEGPGFVGDDGDTYTRFYWDVAPADGSPLPAVQPPRNQLFEFDVAMTFVRRYRVSATSRSAAIAKFNRGEHLGFDDDEPAATKRPTVRKLDVGTSTDR